VRWLRSVLAVSLVFALLTSCGESTEPSASLVCSEGSFRSLAVGEHQVIDPTQAGACLRLPAAPAGGAEYLYVPLATSGTVTSDGVSAPYQIEGGGPLTATVGRLPSPRLSAFQSPLPPQKFHSMLRSRERALSETPGVTFFRQRSLQASVASIPPDSGSQRSFQVCATSACNSFVQTTATVRSVGSRVAIYLDDAAPPGGYSQADLDNVRQLFDQFLYPIDTTAFGRESDIDGNGVVIVLLTQHVNQLSPNCNATRRVILGYFFGADLLPRSGMNPGSNEAEIFYGLVPDPSNSSCDITGDFARSVLPSTFIHEFQHMISYNHHVLEGNSVAEDTWLNEGLSHFAEELGGRQVPDAECPSGSCLSDFVSGDVTNAFEYLTSPESFFLIEPGDSTGSLEERGANWLFVRWLADHFATDTVLGTDLTRRLDQTALVGSDNVENHTGESFSTLVGEWQLANYLDDLPGFSEPTGRLRYKTWNFRAVATAIGQSYPLVPDSTNGASYSRSGVLRAGSGPHVLVVQEPGAAAVDLSVLSPDGTALPGSIAPRISLARVH
jgi:hypothetical protein